ncbi:nucleophile aminohydrolase, partial [Leucosporidium creatinivorum]
NVDGFGVGWYSDVPAKYSIGKDEEGGASGLLPTVYRCDKPPKHDLNLVSLCLTLESKCIMAHLRAVSRDSLQGSPLSNTNNHPFQFGKYLFQHNGGIANFTKIQPRLLMMLSEDARAQIQGTTDSEHFAALFFTFLSPSSAHWNSPITLSHLLATLRRTISTVLSLIAETGGYSFTSSGRPTSWCSLNLAITSGTQLLCNRFADPPEREPPSLYWSTTSGATLDRRFKGHPDGESAGRRDGPYARESRGSHVVVASEPMTRGEDDQWHLMEPNTVLLV